MEPIAAPPARADAWSPLLGGDLAARARQSVARVAAELRSEAQSSPPSFFLGAGLTLGFAYLGRCLEDHELLDAARTAWDSTLDDLSQRNATPALHGGFCGPAWVAAHLQSQLADSSDNESVYEEIESALWTYLQVRPENTNYDLVSGLVGFGVYALERWPEGRTKQIVNRIVELLVESARPDGEGVTWDTAPALLTAAQRKHAPYGYRNLGLAHGIPGIIAFLARAHHVGELSEQGARALEAGVAWLLACQRALDNGTRYPGWVPLGPQPTEEHRAGSRIGWCYGDLGVAAALFVAGRCTGRSDWSSQAVDLARNCSILSPEEGQVRDHGLCHGSAGVGQLFARMARMSGDKALREAARCWLARTLDMRLADCGIDGYASWVPRNPEAERPQDRQWEFVRDPSFLTGAMGTSMALAAGFTTVEPAWDRLLLISS